MSLYQGWWCVFGFAFEILFSVPAINLFIFSRCRRITISGMAVAVVSNGHKSAKFQAGVRIMARMNAAGKVIEAAIEAREIYRHIRTTAVHTAKAIKEQIV